MKWKKLIACMLARSPVPALARRSHRRKLSILMLHGFSSGLLEPYENLEHKHLDVAKWELFAAWLAQHYRVLPLSEVVTAFERGESLPDYAMCLTLDDGFRSTNDLAFPVLRQWQLPATIFLATAFVNEKRPIWVDRVSYSLVKAGRSVAELRRVKKELKLCCQDDIEDRVAVIEAESGYAMPSRVDAAGIAATQMSLDWDQVREMRASGLVEFGSHTHSHRVLGRCSDTVARDELTVSKRLIEEQLGGRCELFCYPNGTVGDFTDVSESLVRTAGYRSSLTTVPGWNEHSASPFALRRLGVNNELDMTRFVLMVSGVQARLEGGWK